MKFDNQAKQIFEHTDICFKDISHELKKFKVYCEDIVNYNLFTKEESTYKFIHSSLLDMQSLLDSAQEKFFTCRQEYNDKHRPSVLFPYEKQAIYEYIKKPNATCSCYRPFGCIYAEKILVNDKPKVVIGLSVCNDSDIFYKNIALNLARTRAREYPKTYDIRTSPIPSSFKTLNRIPSKNMYEGEIARFIKRCTRWFKNEEIVYPNNIIFSEFPTKKVNHIKKAK